jgi:hypothetical protein
MGDQSNRDELDRALERALAVAVAFVRRPATERTLGRVLASAEALARRGWSVPIRALPFQVVEAASDPDEWMTRFYDPMRVGVLELHLRTELVEWQPLMDQIINAFRREEHPLVLVGGLAILESVLARAQWRRDQDVKGKDLQIEDEDWKNSLKFVLASSVEIATERLRPSGDGGRHWTVEGRDSPGGWTREDALKILNALGTASLLLPQRLAKPTVLAPLARPVPTNVTLAPMPVQTVLDDVGSVFRSGGSSDGDA